MDDAEKKLFGLMAVAEDHQKAVKDAIEGLVRERAELAKERAALAEAAAQVVGLADDVKQATAEAVPALRKAVGEAVDASVARSLADTSATAVTALDEACKPIVESLTGMASTAGEAEGKLSKAVASFGWKWATVAGGAAAGGIVAMLLAGWMSVWWERRQVEQLTEQRAALVVEIGHLQASTEDWAKRGGRAKLETCGDKRRLCVRIDKSVGYGKEADYFVLKGY